jgi:hypothetical protein
MTASCGARWKLSPDRIVIAPAYSARRSALAKEIGLGRKPKQVEASLPSSGKVPTPAPTHASLQPSQNAKSAHARGRRIKLLTGAQQHAIDRFAKSLSTLADDALLDAYHQAGEDQRDARAEGSDNLDKVCAERLATEKAVRDRFPDHESRYKARYP